MSNIGDDAGFTSAVSGEFNGGFDFGEHGAGFEIAVFDEVVDFLRRSLVNSCLIG